MCLIHILLNGREGEREREEAGRGRGERERLRELTRAVKDV